LPTQARKVGFVSLGCPKALVDSELILTQLRVEGYEIASTYDDADLVIVNTCGFIDSAVEESLDAIGEALDENGKVIVTGCLGVKRDLITKIHPNVLAITGPQAVDEVMEIVHREIPAEQDPFVSLVPPGGIKLTPRHYAYLKISEGCNQKCSFCIIPTFRGKLVSRPINDVLSEAENLVSAGVRELVVISQDTGAYGVDKKYDLSLYHGRPLQTRIKDLIQELANFGIWVRMLYVYPYPHIDDLIPLMADGKILPYLDVPLQHANQRILKSMRRPASSENNLARIRKWRSVCPDITIRSTFIVGFPGETEKEFEELLRFIEQAQLDRVGCFAYSAVEGAAANALDSPVPEEIKLGRLEQFMDIQAGVSEHKLNQKIGRTMDVIVDEITEAGAVGRSKGDAPDIDGKVFINKIESIEVGDIVKVTITESSEHDLWAQTD